MEVREITKKAKRRSWILSAVIVFLSIMLVLTFFSNTIMNRSLPEVAAQYVSSGTISARIRGTGTVTANSSFDIKLKENRLVKTIAVRRGDSVAVGDVLFILDEASAGGIEELEEQLTDARNAYRLMLINSPYINYTSQNKSIQRLQEALDEAIAERDLSYVTDSQITSAESAMVYKEELLKRIDNAIEDLISQIDDINAEIAKLGSGAANVDLTSLYNAMFNARVAYETAYILHGATYEELERKAIEEYENNIEFANMTVLAKMEAYAIDHQPAPIYDDDGKLIGYEAGADYLTAFNAIRETSEAYNLADKAYTDALISANMSAVEKNQLQSLNSQLKLLEDDKKARENERKSVQKEYDDAKALYDTLKSKKDNYKTLVQAVRSAEDALENAIIALQQTQKGDTVTKTQYDIDLEKAKKAVTDLEEQIAKYGDEDSVGNTITSPVAGVVTSINISPGSTTDYDVSLMTIEETDRGYVTSITVTNEQAQKVRVGDSAEVSNYYWGSNIKATLISITNDPSNPGRGKVLNFMLDGDVSTGDQLNLSIGEKGMNYELIVPNSAVRSDANGYFVLTVQAKSSPLGNRYVATRIDVQVIASDDKNTAVTGPLVSYDYVITTSSAPLEPGMLIRLVEN